MRHNPLSPEELKKIEPQKPKAGTYEFVVEEAEDKVSKAGNEMIAIVLKVNDRMSVRDWLVSTTPWKLKQFLDSVGRPDIYEKEVIDPMLLLELKGKAIFKLDDKYLRVDRYLIPEVIEENEATEEDPEDDIPF